MASKNTVESHIFVLYQYSIFVFIEGPFPNADSESVHGNLYLRVYQLITNAAYV